MEIKFCKQLDKSMKLNKEMKLFIPNPNIIQESDQEAGGKWKQRAMIEAWAFQQRKKRDGHLWKVEEYP